MDDTTWHVWYCQGRKIVNKYSTRDEAYREHRAAAKEGIRSYLTKDEPKEGEE